MSKTDEEKAKAKKDAKPLTEEEQLEKLLEEMKIEKNQYNLMKIEIEAAKSIDFFKRLNGMTERVKCFNSHFNQRLPRHELNFRKRKDQ